MAIRQNIPDERFVELHSTGLINARIAAALGIRPAAVTYRMKKLGLLPNRATKPAPRPLPPAPARQQEFQAPSNGVAVAASPLPEVTLGSAIEDLLIDIDRSRSEVANDAALTERLRVGAYKDTAVALKTIEGMSKARLSVHDGWAEQVIKSFSSFAQRVENALARSAENTGGKVSMTDVMDVMHEESKRVRKSVQEFYMKETEGLHR